MSLAYTLSHSHRISDESAPIASPFLKWVGGKGQLLNKIRSYLPTDFEELDTYIEPFLGGGAVYFDLIQAYPNLKKAYLIDVNADAVSTYQALQHNLESLIKILAGLDKTHRQGSEEKRKEVYYKIRAKYNELAGGHSVSDDPERAAQFIYLNRTGFNGLYRVNSKGEFNVPIGRYANPTILNEKGLRAAAYWLKRASVIHGDFTKAESLTTKHSFVYLDPPYKPVSLTANFNSYHKGGFNDADQVRLADTFKKLDRAGARLMLSNSDPMQKGDPFFEELYGNFNIHRVQATRLINSKASGRGRISEILVTNFED